jgi:asparagine synthase (glutamine-hydrolysing)
MCGIAGVALKRPIPKDIVERRVRRMIARLEHRGPDDQGVVVLTDDGSDRASVCLGNTRLAILDLTQAGHQPMLDSETGNWIVFNGEIYNHLELRQELEDGEYKWRSGSDTETILRAYARWGVECVQRLRGMFAFALHDPGRKTLWCVRDRLGIKPFYYASTADGFVFASEVGALLQAGLVERRCDYKGLADYVRFGSVSEPLTLIEGVKSLPAGSWMKVCSGAILQTNEYWALNQAPKKVNEDEPPASAIRRLLESSVREHMLSDVPVASFLSGGVDSSVITALAARQSLRPLRTFTVVFPHSRIDESRYAKAIARRCGTEHHEIDLKDDEVIGLVPTAVEKMDMPSADGVNSFVVSDAVARSGIKVVLSGLGGDELFGGYRSFRLLAFAQRWAPAIGLAPKLVRKWAPGGERAAELTRRGSSLNERYFALRSFWSTQELHSMGVPPGLGTNHSPEPGPVATMVSVLELTSYMRNVLLRDSDVMSMAHSVETRVPFLDDRVVSYSLRAGAARVSRKGLLLQATADLLPPSIYRRHKQGFELPMDRWIRGPLRAFVQDGLAKLSVSKLLPLVATNQIDRAFLEGRLPWARLWQMVVLGHWAERYLAPGADALSMESTSKLRLRDSADDHSWH